MRSSLGLGAAFTNAVVLLILAAAVGRRRVSRLGRLVIATFAFVCAWIVNAAFAAAPVPSWMIFTGSAVIVVSIVAVLATLQLWAQAGDGGDGQPKRRSDEGGGGPRRQPPDAPHHGGGESDATWWPEFERRFALYAAERERENAGSPAPARDGGAV